MKKSLLLLALVMLQATFSLSVVNAQDDYEFPDLKPLAKSVLAQWNDAINTRNASKLNSLYYDMVLFYKTFSTKEDVAKSHKVFFAKYSYFKQTYSNVKVDYDNECVVGLSFDKRVQTSPGGPYTTYKSYFKFISEYDERTGKTIVLIKEESDTTTDNNIAKKIKGRVNVSKDTRLSQIFCEANVGKKVKVSNWNVDGGSLYDQLVDLTGFGRWDIDDVMHKNYKGQAGTYYCGGFVHGGQCGWPVIYIYNVKTGKVVVLGSSNDDVVIIQTKPYLKVTIERPNQTY